MTPQRIPNIVRRLRSLLARRFDRTWEKTSRMACQADLKVGLYVRFLFPFG
jgi:hypothetical protein